ncbi:MAG: diguanylate cyclase [Paracoccaceae bacterium]
MPLTQKHHLRAQFDRYLIEEIHEASPDAILVVDKQSIIVFHNSKLFEVWKISPDDVPDAGDTNLVGLPDSVMLSLVLDKIKDPEEFLRSVNALYENPESKDSREIELVDGRTLQRHSTSLWDAAHRYLGRVWYFRDISHRKNLEYGLTELSRRDSLTGAANRRYFFERAQEEFTRARRYNKPLSLIVFDIDNFKQINDANGHGAGDRVLQDMSNIISVDSREIDLLGRVGGDEFAVLVPETDLQGACDVAERLRLLVAGQRSSDSQTVVRYTLSLGVATLAPEDTSIDMAFQRADSALYASKHNGRNCVMAENGLRAQSDASGRWFQ